MLRGSKMTRRADFVAEVGVEVGTNHPQVF
jgi:hypothetical protein